MLEDPGAVCPDDADVAIAIPPAMAAPAMSAARRIIARHLRGK
jgi:hypothetical protein